MTLGKDPSVLEGIESEFVGHGLVFGKFMPPTNGHLHFLQFARQSCRKLTIMVCSLPDEPIPGEVRYKWIKELFPDCNVVHHYAEIQQEPKTSESDPAGAEDLEFFDAWKTSIAKHCPGDKFDALFASEDYGFRMADAMGVKFIPVDIRRELVPISGTEMRKNPLKHWEHLHPVIRPYFLKKVALVGPESIGKSNLVEQLAEHFKTVFVGDYARSYINTCEQQMPGYFENNFSIKDISTIARGKIAAEDSLARQANRVMFCDTDLHTTEYWSKFYFDGACPAWVSQMTDERKYSLYLLIDPRGVAQDHQLGAPGTLPDLKDRVKMFEWWEKELDDKGLPYAVISGNDWETRFQNAVVSIYQNIPEMITAQNPGSQFKRASQPG